MLEDDPSPVSRRVARDGKAELLSWISSRQEPRSAARRARRRVARYRELLSVAGLIGLGFGAKVTDGRATGDLAIRAYVRRKVPMDQLPDAHRLPAALAGIPTDVVVIGRPKFQAGDAFPGAAIQHVAAAGPGSIGTFVRRTGSDRLHILSACHVLAPHGVAQPGDVILRAANGATAATPIATLTDFEALNDSLENRFDAAIAALDDGVEAALRVPTMGVPVLPAMQPRKYQSVRKQGATTLHTFGVVMDTDADIPIGLDQEFFFTDMMIVDGTRPDFSRGGDSGALVLDAVSSRPVGLITGGGGDKTFVSPLVRILNRFDAHLAT
ncbi:MAG: hypothetical protein EOP22_08500 [Hyphomicrobiales bacterium]|nr:MAG: hypothetical protein EOP22_08500 [Hyphomicrobiales bacterium]